MWFNPIIKGLLNSPLHFFASKNMLLITYTGRKSGKTYTLPINYIQDGDTLYATSWKERSWWRNLRSGQTVTLKIQGKEMTASPKVEETNEGVAEFLSTSFRIAPNMARYFKVRLDPQGNPIPEDITAAAMPCIGITFKIVN